MLSVTCFTKFGVPVKTLTTHDMVAPQWGTADEENKDLSVENSKVLSFKPGANPYITIHAIPIYQRFLPGNPQRGSGDVSMSPPLSWISGLSFDSTLLSPLLFFCLVLLPFLSYLFLPAGPFV